MSPQAADPREEGLAALLRERGLVHLRYRVEGHEREIAVLSAPGEAWDRLLDPDAGTLIEQIKELGFRYVTLDLDAAAE